MKPMNLIGMRFGKLVVIEKTDERKHGSVVWKCKCDCGRIVYYSARHFIQKHLKSCGCSREENIRKDIAGVRYGRLVAIRPTDKRIGNAVVWECKCDCGNVAYYTTSMLSSKRIVSCGCYNHERTLVMNYKHGLYTTNVYKRWSGIKARCYNPDNINYRNYGGRGITMCDEWLHDPEAFCKWALANGYREDLSIDRIDPNGNYEPSNCRWVDKRVQDLNRRNTRYVTILNERYPAVSIEKELGLFRGWSYYHSNDEIEWRYVLKSKNLLLVDKMTIDELGDMCTKSFNK